MMFGMYKSCVYKMVLTAVLIYAYSKQFVVGLICFNFSNRINVPKTLSKSSTKINSVLAKLLKILIFCLL